jgi:hypothetical protein
MEKLLEEVKTATSADQRTVAAKGLEAKYGEGCRISCADASARLEEAGFKTAAPPLIELGEPCESPLRNILRWVTEDTGP